MNKVYGVFVYFKSGEPVLLREFRSYRAALLHKLEIIDKYNEYNIVIKVRDMSEWRLATQEVTDEIDIQ